VDPPAIHPYQEYINYLEDVVIFNLRHEITSALASPDPTSTNGDDGPVTGPMVVKTNTGCECRMDLPGPTTSVGTRTDYSVGPWDYPACATRHLKAWSTRTVEEKYSVRKLYMSRTVWKTPRRTRLVLSPYSDL
jgi:hypothetical protein